MTELTTTSTAQTGKMWLGSSKGLANRTAATRLMTLASASRDTVMLYRVSTGMQTSASTATGCQCGSPWTCQIQNPWAIAASASHRHRDIEDQEPPRWAGMPRRTPEATVVSGRGRRGGPQRHRLPRDHGFSLPKRATERSLNAKFADPSPRAATIRPHARCAHIGRGDRTRTCGLLLPKQAR